MISLADFAVSADTRLSEKEYSYLNNIYVTRIGQPTLRKQEYGHKYLQESQHPKLHLLFQAYDSPTKDARVPSD